MFRKLLASTALAAVMATGAYANDMSAAKEQSVFSASESATAPVVDENGYLTAAQDQILATHLIGKPVYNGAGENAGNLGDVNDIVMSQNGMAEGIVIGVGGFLGLGEKNVAIDFNEVRWTEREGETWLIVSATRQQLESAPAYEPPMDRSADAGSDVYDDSQDSASLADPQGDQDAMTKSGEQAAADPDSDTVRDEVAELNAPAMTRDEVEATDPDRSEAMTVATGEVSAEELIGTTVYGIGEEAIGEVGDVIVDSENRVEAYVVDIGGFLGLGEKPVAIDPSRATVMENENGDLVIRTEFTETELEEKVAFSQDAWDADRDSVLVR